ncbi:MAG: hypothetical protein GX945_10810 [Lentisphaerae bacterium]|nr:hypothetical protein [Lentisphaerota bacterium]
MKLYAYWCQETRRIDGVDVTTRAGSNVSPAAAQQKLEQRFLYLRELRLHGDSLSESRRREIRAFFAEGATGEEYQRPICEEVVKVLDEHNVITRNRYGALVLNSEDHVFLDIDFSAPPATLFSRLFSAIVYSGKAPADPDVLRQKTIDRVLLAVRMSAFSYLRYRLYETKQGLRLVVGGARIPAQSVFMDELCKTFAVDERYALLCRQQNCFRARLTPKPARLRLAYPKGLRFPYEAAGAAHMAAWVQTYNERSAKYAVCRLLTELGGAQSSPILDIHDMLCKVDTTLPLA